MGFGIWNLGKGIATHFPPVVARPRFLLSLRGTTVPKQSRWGGDPFVVARHDSAEAISVRANEIATHPAGARNDRMRKC
jgi:hypothetical protein